MVMLLYSFFLAAALVLLSPWWVTRLLTKDRDWLRQRLSAVPAALLSAVSGKRVIWLHAVSVGEVLAASRLITELEAALGEGWRVVISTTTRTGQELAKERFGADRVFYFQVDFAWAVRRYLRALKPAALVLMESEIWPRMLHECQQAHIPVIVANARVSDRSFQRGKKLRVAWAWALKKVSLWLAQSEEDARRLIAMGVRAEAVKVAGNPKYDVRAPKQNKVAEQILKWANGRAIVVAGSTCSTGEPNVEERMVANAWHEALRDKENSLLVIAPRHPERFGEGESAIISFWYRKASGAKANKPDEEHPVEAVLLDTIGDLAAVYGIADMAFVGGSLVPQGGHNPLEPAQFGVPVVMGPSYENFRDVVGKMQAANGIRIVKDEVELQSVMVELLAHRDAARAMGERGKRVFEHQQGATKRSVDAIVEMVKP